jgi:hypothetical protein
VFLSDLCIAPATRTVELYNQAAAVFEAYLIHPILIAIEGKHARICGVSE